MRTCRQLTLVATAADLTPLQQRAGAVAPLNETESSDPVGWRRAQLPAANGHATAAAIAGAFGGMARGGELNGARLLSEDRIPLLWEEQVAGMDEVLGFPTRYGLGLFLQAGDLAPHRSQRSFYHPGAGGALGVGDPEHRLGFGYAMNRQSALFARRMPLEESVYSCLSA